MRLLSIILSFIGMTSCTADNIQVLAPADFQKAVEADTTALVLDVRTAEEYAEGHLKDALQLDFLNTEAFDKGLDTLDANRTYYIYCRSGRRSHSAAEKMAKRGFKVFDLQGGYLNWTANQMPVER